MPIDEQSNPDAKFPYAGCLDEGAERGEVGALVQFAFFRPHLAALLGGVAEARLDLIVLKGAALAETVYPRPSLRRFGDMDVLVRRADAARARTLLEALGYVGDPLQWEDLIRGRDCQANFFNHTERGSVVVELHTELINNDLFFGQFRIDDLGLWERALRVSLAGTEARVLGPEDQLLHLCLHLAGHSLAAPQSLRDIAQVCSVSPVDWTLFVRLARESGAGTACFSALFAAARLLGASVPPTVLDSLAPRAGRTRLERISETRAADSITDVTAAGTERLRFRLLWRLLGSPKARTRALGRIIFPSRQWLISHYHHERFGHSDQPEASPRTQWTPDRSRLTVSNAPHFALTFLMLHGVHWASLLRRAVTR